MSIGGVTTAPIERYLAALWERGGSDLLITAFSPPLMRVDGQLDPDPGEPVLDQDDGEDTRAGRAHRRPQVGAARRTARSTSRSPTTSVARFRVNCFFQMGALAMSLRMIPLKLPTFEELGLPPAVEYFANLPQGLVLVTGPTGSGKSTSLAAIIDYINMNRRCHIITIEDPVEYVHMHKIVGGEPARGRQRHALVRPGAARRACVKTPT